MTAENSKQTLEMNGWFTDLMWNISDVQKLFECTDKEARLILANALSDYTIISRIWTKIGEQCLKKGFTPKYSPSEQKS